MVWGDEIFEAVDILQEMFAHDQVCMARIGAADIVENALEHFQQKSACAAGEIQHRDALVVGQPRLDGESVFQDIIHRPHDEAHYRRGRVIDAARLARVLVVMVEEILVEINEGVALEEAMLLLVSGLDLAARRLAMAEGQVLVKGEEIKPVDDGQHLLHHPAHPRIFMLFQLGQEIDEFANELERGGHEIARIAQGDGRQLRVEPRQKQPIGEHLREGVGELFQGEFLKHLFLEHLIEAQKPPFLMLLLLSGQFLEQGVAQQPRAGGERDGELRGPPHALRRGGEEAAQQLAHRLHFFGTQAELAVFQIAGVAKALALHASLADPDEMQIVREDDIA